jgi:L-fuconolactonase
MDAHQHFWRLDRGDYGWLTPAATLYRDLGPPTRPILARHGMGARSRAGRVTAAEDALVARPARDTPFVAGVVG